MNNRLTVKLNKSYYIRSKFELLIPAMPGHLDVLLVIKAKIVRFFPDAQF